MLLNADEVSRSLRGSWSLLRAPAASLRSFDITVEGFWRSFAAIILTVPAYLTILAAHRTALGLPRGSSLFDDPGLVVQTGLLHVALFGAFPVLMLAYVRWAHRERGFVPYAVMHNWSTVIVATLFALPLALYAIGWATPALTACYLTAFAVIVAKIRFSVARLTLGVSPPAAAGLTAAEFGLALWLISLV